MKIERKKKETVIFENVEVGGICQDGDDIFMKIRFDDSEKYGVNLKTGVVFNISAVCHVTPLAATLLVEEAT